MTFSIQQNAIETAVSPDRRHSLSTTQVSALKSYLLSDSYAFAEVICGHEDGIPEFHAPISYLYCHLTDRLIECLNDPRYDSYVTTLIRAQLQARSINWNTPEGRNKLDSLLDIVDIRIYRGSFKSSYGTHAGGLFIGTVDPNRTEWIVSNSDPNAWAFSKQIGETVLSGPYQDWFPERIPSGSLKEQVTDARITLGGRTISHPQTNIEADGYETKRISAHFDTFLIDDLVVRENSGPAYMEKIKQWLAGMPGFEMATRRTWVRFLGTRWSETDDHALLMREEFKENCLHIVIPIETYKDGIPENIRERGTPTNPKLHDTPKIASLQAKYLTDEKEGPISWRCNALLDASANSGRIFADHVIDDLDRRWKLVDLPKDASEDRRKRNEFFVSIPKRDAEGKLVINPKTDKPVIKTYDPMRHLDRVMTIDPAWVEGGDNWGVHIEGTDYDGDRIQLESVKGNDGQEGWIDAACELDARWKVRAIGFDGGAYQDVGVQNLMRLDPRLRKLRGRMVKVPHRQLTKVYRIKQNVAEPLKSRTLYLDPRDSGWATRDEMRKFKVEQKEADDALLDAISMAPAVSRRKKNPDQQRGAMPPPRIIDPVTGVPFESAA